MENPPAGSHLARCYAVIDMGTQSHTFQGDTRLQRDVRLSFELPTELMTGKYDPKAKGRPHSVHVTSKMSLHPKARLRKLLKGWRGKDFTPEEAETFDPKKLVGLAARLSLVEDGDFVNIDAVSPVDPKKEKLPKQINPPIFVSLEEGEFEPEMFERLSPKSKEKIQGSPEYKKLVSEHGEGEPASEPEAGDGGGQSDDTPF